MAHAHLREAVLKARIKVDLTTIHERSGLTANFIRRIEHYQPGREWSIRRDTLHRLDLAFDWPDEHAQELYDRDPEPAEIVVHDAVRLAGLVGEHVLNGLATRLRIGLELADAAQSS